MKLEFTEQIIAFIDVLGFSALVNQGDHESLNRYFEAVDFRINLLRDFVPGLKCLQISDSIILAVPPDPQSLKNLIDSVKHLQIALFEQEMLTRGAITIGELNSDIESGRIVGKGFIQAYELEKLSKFPRVLIDPKILRKFDWTRSKFFKLYNQNNRQVIHHLNHSGGLLKDDELFVSYLNDIFWEAFSRHNKQEPNKHLEKIHQFYSFLRSNIYNEIQHTQKYRWIRDYILEIIMCIEITVIEMPYNDARLPRAGLLPAQPIIAPLYDKFLEL